jgi:biotin transporter BioY
MRLMGPTGGYLVGFVAAAFITGVLAERGWDRKVITTALAMLFGNVIIYAFGLPWLARFVGIEKVLGLGLYPFIPGDLIKLVMAAISLPFGWKMLKLKDL